MSRLGLQLGALVALALAPLVILETMQAADRRQRELAQQAAFTTRVADIIASQNQDVMNSMHAVLAALSEAPAVRRADQGCFTLLESFNREHDRFNFIGVVDAAGDVKCASPFIPGVHVRGRLWFDRVQAQREFVLGEYAIGRTTGKPVIHAAFPILAGSDFAGAINAAIDVEWLAARLAAVPERPATVYYILDGEGAVLAASPPGTLKAGTRIADPALLQRTDRAPVETRGLDGVERLVALRALFDGGESGRLFAAVAVDRAAILAVVDGEFRRALAVLAGVAALALLAIAGGLQGLVVRPLRRMLGVADRIEHGDLSARVGPVRGGNEVGRLAGEVDAMAAALEARERDRLELGHKEVLLREAAHRVKNHLTTVGSMLSFEGRRFEDSDAGQAFTDLQHRVVALARFYDLLATSPGDAVALTAYLTRLCEYLSEFANGYGRAIVLDTRFSGEATIPPEKAVSLGLLVNEIVTNSVKHAFPEGMGRILLELDARDPAALRLTVADDGDGWEMPQRRASLGLTVIDAMIGKLGGRMQVSTASGSRYDITFAA